MPTAGTGSLAEEAYLLLRRQIVRGELPAGRRLVARDLCRTLDLGATPVREALARLDTEGLVVTLPRRGYVVPPVTARDAHETVQAWTVLAPALIRLALARATEAQAARVVAAMTLHGVVTDAGTPDVATLAESRGLGWRLLAEAGGNRLLADMYRLVDGRLIRLFILLFGDDRRVTGRSTMDWAQLFAARDPDGATAAFAVYEAGVRAAVEQAARRLPGA